MLVGEAGLKLKPNSRKQQNLFQKVPFQNNKQASQSSYFQPVRKVLAAQTTIDECYISKNLEGKNGLDVAKVDGNLFDYEHHLSYRWSQFISTLQAIEQNEGGLLNFAKGYERFGFNRCEGGIVYREWAPAAQSAELIGDFNNWQGSQMEKDQFGVWSITIPDDDAGNTGIGDGSRVKIRLQSYDGWKVDLIPAWISWATQQAGVMGGHYDGVFFDRTSPHRYQWKYESPKKPSALRIYEAHVGMSSEEPVVASYTHFKDNVLPRIAGLGYNAIQLMAVQEHVYYGSFGYHVTSPFAVSSRCGTPDELKALVDEAHRLGLYVLLDVVHSHISKNASDGLAGFDMGQSSDMNYFYNDERGYHQMWDSRCLNYENWEVLRYLLSNIEWWLCEYRFDGFRFDGVTSMLYHNHGMHFGFSGNYHDYFGPETNVDACVYLMLANLLMHRINPHAVSIAEDVSGMPALGRGVEEGGLGFDYRLAMAIPDKWIQLLKEVRDEEWSMMDIVTTLCNRRYSEYTISYAESHDQALVGDKTIAFRLMDSEMYTGMSSLVEQTPVISRGLALHKMIRLLTMAIGGEGWLNFMGNEFGHPEWIDFPREGNDWSHDKCRRLWSLADQPHLLYYYLQMWDKHMMQLDQKYNFLAHPHQIVSSIDQERQVIVAERGPLAFVFNLSPFNDYEGLKIGVGEGGKYRVALDSDALCYGGQGRVGHDVDHFTHPEGTPGVPDTNFNDRPHSMLVLSPSRTAVVYARMEEKPNSEKFNDVNSKNGSLVNGNQQT